MTNLPLQAVEPALPVNGRNGNLYSGQGFLAERPVSVCTSGRSSGYFFQAFRRLEIEPDETGGHDTGNRNASQVAMGTNAVVILWLGDGECAFPGFDVAEDEVALLDEKELLPRQLGAIQRRLVKRPASEGANAEFGVALVRVDVHRRRTRGATSAMGR